MFRPKSKSQSSVDYRRRHDPAFRDALTWRGAAGYGADRLISQTPVHSLPRMAAPVLVVSGCSAVGKSTVSRLLAGSLDSSVNIPTDVFLSVLLPPWWRSKMVDGPAFPNWLRIICSLNEQ